MKQTKTYEVRTVITRLLGGETIAAYTTAGLYIGTPAFAAHLCDELELTLEALPEPDRRLTVADLIALLDDPDEEGLWILVPRRPGYKRGTPNYGKSHPAIGPIPVKEVESLHQILEAQMPGYWTAVPVVDVAAERKALGLKVARIGRQPSGDWYGWRSEDDIRGFGGQEPEAEKKARAIAFVTGTAYMPPQEGDSQ